MASNGNNTASGVARGRWGGQRRGRSWEDIPEEEKGEGKIRRKASPGSWREDLTKEQVRIVEGITAPILVEFYP